MKPYPPLALALSLLAASALSAQVPNQRPPPRLGYAYPGGGQQGTTFRVTVGGQTLAGADAAWFSHPGIRAKVLGYERPLTQQEYNDAREQLQQLQEKRAAAGKAPARSASDPAWTAADDALLAALRLKVSQPPNRQANPAIAESVRLEVTLAPDAPLGEHELRLRATTGLSNPIVFCVGALPEFTHAPVTPTTPATRAGRTAGGGPVPTKPARDIALPAIVNGQILPGEIDRLRFAGTRGQRLTVRVSARALMPYLADAVPGWFQPAIALFDATGRELAYADDYRFNPDPVLCYRLPADGHYTLAIKDAISRGREDFIYRLALGELPFVTAIFPLGTPPRDATTLALAGWNLPTAELRVDTLGRPTGAWQLAVRNNGQLSNTVPFSIDPQTAVLEAEPNDRLERSQAVSLPLVVDGRVGWPGDRDAFRFTGRAGEAIVAEVVARRLGSPLDSRLELLDAAGNRLALNDDQEDRRLGRDTHHADSRLELVLPATGHYHIRLTDTQGCGGDEYGYRLRLGPPRPDFELRVTPSTLNVRAGTSVPFTVHALRQEGYAGEILVGLGPAPAGFLLSGGRIPPGADRMAVTLTAPPAARSEPVTLQLVGQARIDGRNVTHPAVPADDLEQAFFLHHLVPAREWKVNVSGRAPSSRLLTATPLLLRPGQPTRLEAALVTPRPPARLHVELSPRVDGVAVASASSDGGPLSIVLVSDAARMKPGTMGNLILHVYVERDAPAPTGPTRRLQRSFHATLPAVPFEIIAPAEAMARR